MPRHAGHDVDDAPVDMFPSEGGGRVAGMGLEDLDHAGATTGMPVLGEDRRRHAHHCPYGED